MLFLGKHDVEGIGRTRVPSQNRTPVNLPNPAGLR
jgi:hypothetical protein